MIGSDKRDHFTCNVNFRYGRLKLTGLKIYFLNTFFFLLPQINFLTNFEGEEAILSGQAPCLKIATKKLTQVYWLANSITEEVYFIVYWTMGKFPQLP